MSVDFYQQDELMVITPYTASGGKSAYAHAVSGGYTGTEEEFNERLAFLMNGTVVGYLEGSTIVLSGDLSPGTYTAYYKLTNSDGTKSLVEIGQLSLSKEEPSTTYTVTFMADGIVVAEIEYSVGDAIAEPAVPAKDGYTGAWETYDLTNGGDMTVNAVYTVIEPTYTNILTSGAYTVNLNKRWSSSSKAATDCDGMIYLKIPIADVKNKTIYFKGFPANAKASNQAPLWFGLDSSNARIATLAGTEGGSGNLWISTYLVDEGNGVYSIPINATTMSAVNTAGAYLLIDMATVNGSTAVTSLDGFIITIGEPIA